MLFHSKNEKFIFYTLPTVLFSLIPFFLITGPFLSDLSISLIAILFLVYCFKEKKFSYFKNKYFFFFIIFWAYLLFNSIVNNINFDSLKISFFYFRYGVFIIAIVFLLNIDSKFIKYFFYCILICFSVLILDGYYQYFVGHNILGFKSPNLSRVSSFFNDEMILGSYLSRIWPLFFGISILLFNLKNKLFLLFTVIFILSEVLIFLSGDRTAFFYINLSAVFVILFSSKLKKLRFFTLILSILLILILSFFNPAAKNRIFDKTLVQMNLTENATQENKQKNLEKKIYIFSQTHDEIYFSALAMFLDNKALGVGVKNFRNFCSDEKYKKTKLSCSTHPHNFYIQMLAETGIFGFLFLITTLVYFCKYILKHVILKYKGKKYFNDFEICILSGIAIYLWPFVPTGSIFNNWLNIIMILYMPFLIWSKKKYSSTKYSIKN